MKKKYLSILISLMLCFSLMPTAALAEDTTVPETLACNCTVKCTEDSQKEDCTICMTDITNCTGSETPALETPENTGLSVLEYRWSGTELTSASKKIEGTYLTVDEAADFGGADTNWSGTYYVCENVTIDYPILSNGDVTLIIAPDKTLTINGNIENKTAGITIYGQASKNGSKGTLTIDHEAGSSTAMKVATNLTLHGIDLQITNKTPENSAAVGPALDASANINIYGSTLDIESDSTAMNANNTFIFDSDLKITSPAALSATNSLKLYDSTLAITGKATEANTSTGMLAKEILLENCKGSITSSYGAGISPTESLTICGTNTDLKIAITSGHAITIPNNSFSFTLEEGLYITDHKGISVDPANASMFAECNKLDINTVVPSEIIPSITVNGVELLSGNWLAKDTSDTFVSVSGEPDDSDDNYAYFCDNVLILKNFTGNTIRSNDTLLIILEGTNILAASDTAEKIYGISVENGNLQIIGTGSLQVQAENTNGQSTGLFCDQAMQLYAAAVSITVAGSENNMTRGIQAEELTLADCNLTIYSSDLGIDVSQGTFRIFGGTLDIQAGNYVAVYNTFYSEPCVQIQIPENYCDQSATIDDRQTNLLWDTVNDQPATILKAKTEHNWLLSEWQKDDYGHWHKCTNCSTVIDYVSHSSIADCSTCTPVSGGDSSGSSSSGGSSSGSNSTPSDTTVPDTPSAQQTTVPISGEDNTIHVEVSISEDKAVVDYVDLGHLDSVIGEHVETGTVTIDFSDLDTPVTTVEIPSAVVKEIAAAVSAPANDAHSFEIVLADGMSITFDAEALGKKAAQAGGLDITISIQPSKELKLTAAQNAALKGRPAYDISVMSGGEHISDMDGKITVHAPYELQNGEHPNGIVVWYVSEDGKRERCETSYDEKKKRVSWKTDHLSLYMIDYDETQVTSPFRDVSEDAYYHDAVLWAVNSGITSGTTADTFSPDASCTRAQMAAFLWRAAGSPEPEGSETPFVDVKKDDYYAKAVQWVYEQGITSGTTANAFSPDALCTRAQAASFIYRTEQANGGGFQGAWMFPLPFKDVPAWAFEAAAWCYMNGITSGTTADTFSPDASCTRAQMVTFMYRYFTETE